MRILAFAEQRDGKLKKSAFEVVKAARTVADQIKGDVVALVIGDAVQGVAGSLGAFGAQRVLAVEDSRLAKYSTTAFAKIIAEISKKENAGIVLLAATAMGKDCGPRAA
ncbi:MAG TPA: electron transfer flavoprotein subunit alpha/FixB family protein, partial [Bacteroidota bacterium]|nr:electron transfer flavoprotein subunit alpha/FixB family protein [Bacteroidota bacterium]